MSELQMLEELMDLMNRWIARGEHPLLGGFIFSAAAHSGLMTAPREWRWSYLLTMIRGFLFGLS